MLRVSHQITNNLLIGIRYGISFGKTHKPNKDLAKYDVIVAGGNLGGLLARHLNASLGPKANILVLYEKNAL